MDVAPLLGIHPCLHPHDDVRVLNVNPNTCRTWLFCITLLGGNEFFNYYCLKSYFWVRWWHIITFAMSFWRVVSEICGQTFGTDECFFLGPRKQVGNMIIMKFGVVIFFIVFMLVEICIIMKLLVLYGIFFCHNQSSSCTLKEGLLE